MIPQTASEVSALKNTGADFFESVLIHTNMLGALLTEGHDIREPVVGVGSSASMLKLYAQRFAGGDEALLRRLLILARDSFVIEVINVIRAKAFTSDKPLPASLKEAIEYVHEKFLGQSSDLPKSTILLRLPKGVQFEEEK